MPVQNEDRLLVSENAAANLLILAAQIALDVSENTEYKYKPVIFSLVDYTGIGYNIAIIVL